MENNTSRESEQSSGKRKKAPSARELDRQNSENLSDIPELLQQNSILRTVVDALSDLVSIQDTDFKLIAVNKAYSEAVKMKPEEIIGKKCYAIVHGTDVPASDCPHIQTLQTKKTVTRDLEEPHLGKILQITASPIFNNTGEIMGTIHLMKDITGYKKIEDELLRSNQRFRNLVEATSDFMWEVNKKGEAVYVSPKIFDILGYRPEEMIGKTPFDLMPPEEAERILPIFRQCVSRESPIDSLEYMVYHKEGYPVYLETSGVPVYDTEGSFQGYRGIDRDITHRKLMDEILRKSEERFRQYFNLGLVGMAIESPTGEWVEVNDRLCEIYGYPREELLQLHWKDLTYPDDLEKDLAQFEQLLRGKKNKYSLEKRYIRKDGKIIHAVISAGCTRDPKGEVSSIFVLVADITERKRAEEALARAKDELEMKVKERTAELAEAKSHLEVYTREIIRVQETERKRLAVELHDDTAQNLALLNLEMDKIISGEEKLPEDTLSRLKKLRDDIDRVQKDVRRFSHELRPGVLDYLGLEAALEGLADDINDKGEIRVNVEVSGKERRLPDEVDLSLFRIAQEALNNSLKHSQATRTTVNLRFFPERVILSISDNGKGFDVRKDGQEAVKRRRLGLIGMKERAELIGGKIKIRSVVGKGTTISIEVAL